MIRKSAVVSDREEVLKEQLAIAWAEAELRCEVEGVAPKDSHAIFSEEAVALVIESHYQGMTRAEAVKKVFESGYGFEQFTEELELLHEENVENN